MRTFEEITKKMADIELDPQTHGNDIEDYENEQDFYMENVQADSYEEYLKDNLTDEEKATYDIVQLWKAIENLISENCRPE
jgi:hypothetical protein